MSNSKIVLTPDVTRLAGYTRGRNIAANCDMPKIGDMYDGYTVTDKLTAAECLIATAHDAENEDRSFTPFEVTASAINKSDDSEALWQAYDEGIAKGIADEAAVRMERFEPSND